MKFNYIYYIISIISLIWSHNFPTLYVEQNEDYSYSSSSQEFESYDDSSGQPKMISNFGQFILHRFCYIMFVLLAEEIIEISINFVKAFYNHNIGMHIITSLIDDVNISMHRDYALDGYLGLFFNRYSVKYMCSIVGIFLFIIDLNSYDIPLTIFAIFYDMSRAVRWRILPEYDYQEILSFTRPSEIIAEAVNSVEMLQNEINEETRHARNLEYQQAQQHISQAMNDARAQYLDCFHRLYIAEQPEPEEPENPDGDSDDTSSSSSNSSIHNPIDIIVDDDTSDDEGQPANNPHHQGNINQEPPVRERITDEQKKLIKEEMAQWKKRFNDLTNEEMQLYKKWYEFKSYNNTNYLKVKIDKMEDLEKYAKKYDHFIYTRTKGRISFASKLWTKFEDGLYEYTRQKSYEIVHVEAETTFVNLLCIHAHGLLQKLLLNPLKIKSNSMFKITRTEQRLLTRCYYAKRLYSSLDSYLKGKSPNIEILQGREYEALIAFACSHAFADRGLGRFEHWMSLDSNEFYEEMGFTLEN